MRIVESREEYRSGSEEQTRELGKLFSRNLRIGDVVALNGQLGSGKTRFVQGLLSGLDSPDHATSPTFTLIHEYRGGLIPVFHIDLYRIEQLQELTELGIADYFDAQGIVCIEWAERIESFIPQSYYRVTFHPGLAETDRIITIERISEAEAA